MLHKIVPVVSIDFDAQFESHPSPVTPPRTKSRLVSPMDGYLYNMIALFANIVVKKVKTSSLDNVSLMSRGGRLSRAWLGGLSWSVCLALIDSGIRQVNATYSFLYDSIISNSSGPSSLVLARRDVAASRGLQGNNCGGAKVSHKLGRSDPPAVVILAFDSELLSCC
jgi:hypothetical protein